MYMTELLRNAWMGWQDYTEDGKLVALLLAVLLFLWLTGKGKKQGTLVLYSSLAVFCCIRQNFMIMNGFGVWCR